MALDLKEAVAKLVELTAARRRDEAAELAKQLAGESSRIRGSVRPRGTIENAAPAQIGENCLVTLVERVPASAPPEVLDVAAELGGHLTANAIATRLGDADSWRDEGLRSYAIAALETLGGVEATDALTKIAVASQGKERSQSFDALVSLASVDSTEVSHGGVMPTPRSALDLWGSSRERLVRDPIGWAIASLEQLAETEPRAGAARAALLAAAESRFHRLGGPRHGERPNAYVKLGDPRFGAWCAAEALSLLKNARPRKVALRFGPHLLQGEGVASVSFVDGDDEPVGPVDLFFGSFRIGTAVLSERPTELFDKRPWAGVT